MREMIFLLGGLLCASATSLDAITITQGTFSIAEPGTLTFLYLGGGMIVAAILLRRLSRR
jgi:hypothetical protein